MRKLIFAVSTALAVGITAPAVSVAATIDEDVKAFQNYYYTKFPDVGKSDFVNGVYSINEDFRAQWENQEEFPPYEEFIEEGEEMFNTPFANGKTYADCLKNGGIGTRQMYPFFDKDSGEIVTLEGEINRCRTENGEKALGWKKGKLASLTAYIAHTSRGNTIDIDVPNDPRAIAAYERGKKHFFMKRGQLNLACADCHYYNAGMFARSDQLSPALGHLSHFPVYRLKWQSLGTPHRRFGGCNKQVRAKDFKAQSDEYKALEYFLMVSAKGLESNGPALRK